MQLHTSANNLKKKMFCLQLDNMLGITPSPFLEDWFSSLHSITILKPFPPSAMLSHCSAPNVLLVRVTLGGSRESGWVGSPWAAMEVVWRITLILGKQLTAEDDSRHNHPNIIGSSSSSTGQYQVSKITRMEIFKPLLYESIMKWIRRKCNADSVLEICQQGCWQPLAGQQWHRTLNGALWRGQKECTH